MGDKPVIRVGHLKITDHLVLGVTKYKISKGLEKPASYSLETAPMVGWDYIGDSLVKGQINAACMLAPYAMELFHSGQKIKLILFTHKTGSVIITNKRCNIQKIEDFKGKTVLIPFHLSIHMMLFRKMFEEQGMEVGPGKDVVFDVIAPAQIPEVMSWDEEGDIGGFMVAEPFGSQVVKEGNGEEFALSKDLWPDHPCCALVITEELAERNPDAVAELCRSLVHSGKIIESKPPEAAKIGAAFLDQDVGVIESVLTNPVDRLKTGNLKPVIDDLDTIQNYMTSEVSAMSGKIDLEKFVNLSFANEAGAS
jgi:NitT/TauT family transport system substrate-binding protein